MQQTKEKDTLRVIGKNILIKKLAEQKFGNLLLITSSNENYFRGIVLGLGSGFKDSKTGEEHSFEVKINDEVFFPKHKGYEVRLGEDSYVIMREDEIIAIVG